MSDSLIHSLWLATALMLIIEGVLPFVNPTALRRALLQVATMTDQQLRITGLLSMVAGLLILYWVN
ncbi:MULTISPECIES: DUF2065 domain-containing protein [unclassified Methylophaga]|uniref:DUF2065 domain-containing protein n=1 Tax=unclassified Methylophaga TaxID=2629249 RepID=UPI000C95FE50|nr:MULTISPECIES: DUF2065 domain-containing protein [unclassified Methylophaga]MAK66606.1 DUF2065 domain-containing protein [Methylophaga sp.]MAY17516.1 DUF2065 domain-containing protein [Methylophaga sp.]MBN47458.1 DUF2065 domain-containing protein [Methylophaga sp.]